MRALAAKYSMSIVSRSPSVRSSSANGNSTVSSSLACPRTRNANCRTNAFHLRSAVSVASRCSIKPCSCSPSASLATAKLRVFGVSYRGPACGFYVHRATHDWFQNSETCRRADAELRVVESGKDCEVLVADQIPVMGRLLRNDQTEQYSQGAHSLNNSIAD